MWVFRKSAADAPRRRGRSAARLAPAAAAALLLLGTLAGCATAARSTAMVAPVSAETLIDAEHPLYGRVALGAVSGGEETNPLWTSEVSAEDFRRALDISIALTTLKAPGGSDAPFVLDAVLETVEQPQLAIDFTVTVTALYRLRRAADGAILYNERLTSPFTARLVDHLVRAERLRLANEGAVKANISAFLERLIAAARATPERFATP